MEGNIIKNETGRGVSWNILKDPESSKSFNNIGLIYRHTTNLMKRWCASKKVVELSPNDKRGYILLASTYKMMGCNQEANQILLMSKSIRSGS